MISRFSNLLWLALALLCGSAFAQDEIRWASDLSQGRQMSMQYKVPLLVHFYGDNCLPCKTLEQRVLSDQEVVRILNKFFICVRINATQSRKIAAEFQVHSWPTDVFVSPDGKTLHQGVCPQDLRSYVGVLENVAVMNRDRNLMLAAQQPVQPADSIAQQTSPVGSSTNMAPQLPPPGANLITSSTTPSFYDATRTTSLQGLPASQSPAAGMQSGPLLANGQPASITGSTPSQHQQLDGPANPEFISAQRGTLAPRPEQVGRIDSPMESASVAGQLVGFSLPDMNSTTTSQASSAPDLAKTIHRFDSNAQGSPSAGGQATVAGESQPARGRPTTTLQANTFVNNPYYREPSMRADAQAQSSVPSSSASLSQQPQSTAAPGPVSQPQMPQPAVEQVTATLPAAGELDFQPRSTMASQSSSAVAAKLAAATNDTSAKPEPAPPTTEPAIGGFCPVALLSAEWVDGEPQFAVRHRGRIYWLSSKVAQEKFLRSPDACSPILSGYDPMIFLTEGRMVEGSIEHGLHEPVSGRNLFFASKESKDQYEQDYDRHTKALMVFIDQAKAPR